MEDAQKKHKPVKKQTYVHLGCPGAKMRVIEQAVELINQKRLARVLLRKTRSHNFKEPPANF